MKTQEYKKDTPSKSESKQETAVPMSLESQTEPSYLTNHDRFFTPQAVKIRQLSTTFTNAQLLTLFKKVIPEPKNLPTEERAAKRFKSSSEEGAGPA